MSEGRSRANVRLADVAAMAGVSLVTASKAISNNTSNKTRVSAETKARILKIARQLGYRPNVAAKMLAGKSAKAIGVLLDLNSPAEHFVRVSMMQKEAELHGYCLVIGECRPELGNIANFIGDFVARGVDGFITMAHVHPHIGREVVELFKSSSKPTVYYDMPPAFNSPDLACILIDFASGVEKAVRHLHASGRRRISLLMPWFHVENGLYHFTTERERGFEKAMNSFGLSFDKTFNYRNNIFNPSDSKRTLTCESAFPVIKRLIEEQSPDAVVAVNDGFGSVLISYCLRNGIKVPEDIAVIGFDKLDFGDFVCPRLSTLDPHTENAARAAVGLLVEMIGSGGAPEPRQISFTPDLVLREST